MSNTPSQFIWPLNGTATPDEMNTSYGPRIDADRWDFHDGIDLPAAIGTPIYAMANGVVHRAGPADKTTSPTQGFGSTHVLLQVVDPNDGKNDLFLVYIHLDSIAEAIIVGANVTQGDLIGAVGQEDAEYSHLHMEFRKGGPQEERSVHPLNYLPYPNEFNFTQPQLDRVNFYEDGKKSAVRICFEDLNRREGDLRGVEVELSGRGVANRKQHVDFDDRATIDSDKGDDAEFKNGIAVEGYQKSNLKGDGLDDLHYGVIVADISPEFEAVELRVVDVQKENVESAQFPLPKLEPGERPVNSSVSFEGQTFPPRGWELELLAGNVCRPDKTAALSGQKGLLCQDVESSPATLIRAGLRFALPAQRMSWRIRANIRPAELEMSKDQVIHPLAFLSGDQLIAAACLRKIRDDKFVAGVVIRSGDVLFRERLDVIEGEISLNTPVRWELDLLRIGTRQTTTVLRLGTNVVARIDGDTTSIEPDNACVGILHPHSGLRVTLHIDQLVLTETPRL